MPTQRHTILITDSTGATEITSIQFGRVAPGTASDPVTLRVYNAATDRDITTCRLFAGRSDCLISDPAAEEAYYSRRAGRELVDEAWLEAKLDADPAYAQIDEYSNFLSLGGILREGYVTINVRLNIASDATSFGDVAFNLILRSA